MITILKTVGPLLTKVFKADGTVDSYDDAASFTIDQAAVANLAELSRLLQRLEGKPKCCLIRGTPKPEAERVAGNVAGAWLRQKVNFTDEPQPWLMIDIDKYRPGFADPVLEPELAVQDFIRDHLPAEFQNVSFHWQLSSSAGTPGKEGVLKAHVYFWLDAPRTCAELYAWGSAFQPQVDRAPLRLVQVHYTANPIFEAGVADPVPVRSGLWVGAREDVPLVITDEMRANVRVTGAGCGGEDMKLLDPRAKPGVLGAFHRVYSAEQVLTDLLDEFEIFDERRVTWRGGGGAEQGVWIHDDRMHVGSSHNTWPLEGIANLWDVVRVFKFGHLDDEARTGDDFADMDLTRVGHRPSDLAMLDYASELAPVKEDLAKVVAARAGLPEEEALRQSIEAAQHWRQKITDAPDELSLRNEVCRGVREDTRLTGVERDAMANAIKRRLQALGVVQSLGVVRQMLTQPVEAERTVGRALPEWLQGYYYVTDDDKFYRYDRGEWLTQQGFNAKFNRRVRGADPDAPSAYTMALEQFGVETVRRTMYWPGCPEKFAYEGGRVVNLYRPSSVPGAAEAGRLTDADRRAVETVLRHVGFVCGGREWLAALVVDWLAHNVQQPGVKIRFTPLIQGIEGDGKSLLGTLLAVCMGADNVRVISPKVIATDFNGWAEGSAVGVLEEIRLVGHNRHDILNAVKPCITNDTIAIHRKGKDEYNCPNVTNYIAFTNHKDALPLDDTDRRWWVIFTPWKNRQAMEGVVGEGAAVYFERLHGALMNHGPALRRWLLDHVVGDAFNRHGAAPYTEEKEVMVMLGQQAECDEQGILSLIEEGGVGVCREVLSSAELTSLIRDTSDMEPPKTSSLHRLLANLGYVQLRKVVKWRGVTRRIWVTGALLGKAMDFERGNDFVREKLDATINDQLSRDFED